jgi:hypothetical protein
MIQALHADGTEVRPHAGQVAVCELFVPRIIDALRKRITDLREIDTGMPDPLLAEERGGGGGSLCLADADRPRNQQHGDRTQLTRHPIDRTPRNSGRP